MSPQLTSVERTPEPSVFVVFGATGDLAKRKILPALYQLHHQKYTERGCVILGVSRDVVTDEAFRTMAYDAVAGEDEGEADETPNKDVADWAAKWLFFYSVKEGTKEDYAGLKAKIEALEVQFGFTVQNRGFYLALPPSVFPGAVKSLGDVGLNTSTGWTKVVVEKPFGRDLASARALNELIHACFDEAQVYRIDHYLGKETVQNLLVFRFANAMFESLWNRNHIESIMITVAEELGVEARAAYYEKAGALRDMIQSHLTQLMTIIGMEVPAAMDAQAIRAEKLKVLRGIRPLTADDAVLGQYESGTIDGKTVVGYREEPGVGPDSNTETYAAVSLHIDNWRWQGVPFFLRTGKRMAKRQTEIEIKFRRAPVWMFRNVTNEDLRRNTLLLTMQPNEGFSLYFDVKAPGEPFRIQRLPLHFNYSEEFKSLPEAYQTLILDILLGDQTLFVHADEVEASWSLYAPLLDGRRAVYAYPAGHWGPMEASTLLARGVPLAAVE